MNSRIRIAIVNEGGAGGIRKQVFQLSRQLDPDRFEVTLIFSTRREYEGEGDPVEELQGSGVQWIRVPMVRQPSLFYDIRSIRTLRRLLTKERFDIVHARSAKAGFLARLVCKLNHFEPCLYSPHVFPFQRAGKLRSKLYWAAEKLAANWTTAFIVSSEAERRHALKLVPDKSNEVFVLRNAAEIPVIQPGARAKIREELQTPQDRVVFLSTGRLIAYKGYDVLIEAIARAQRRFPGKVELWIAGEGAEREKLQKLIRNLDCARFVKLLGYRRDINELLQASDCFVLVSRGEGSPNSLLEALANEKPVIAAEVEGITELLTKKNCFQLVPWNSVDALSEVLSRFVENPFRGAALASLPEEWFDLPDHIKKLEAIYERMLQARSSAVRAQV